MGEHKVGPYLGFISSLGRRALKFWMDIHAGKHGHMVNWDKIDIQARKLEISFPGHMVIGFRKVIFNSVEIVNSNVIVVIINRLVR